MTDYTPSRFEADAVAVLDAVPGVAGVVFVRSPGGTYLAFLRLSFEDLGDDEEEFDEMVAETGFYLGMLNVTEVHRSLWDSEEGEHCLLGTAKDQYDAAEMLLRDHGYVVEAQADAEARAA